VTRVEVFVALLFVIVPLVAIGKRINVAYPIVLVLGGLAIGFLPGMPSFELPPDVVLVSFLPPLLYWEAISAPVGAMRSSVGFIRTLVVGLVVATTCAVAAVAHALVPNLPWSVAFVMGAVVAPTDAVAFAPVASRFGVPHRTIAIIEAEGLLNDASALVIYGVAIAAVSSGSFSLSQAIVQFVFSVVSSIVLGVAVAWIAIVAWRRIRDTDLQTVISVIVPYLAYLPAWKFGISGVLAVVACGLVINRFAVGALTPESRERSRGFWRTVAFIMNAVIFLLVGLQLHPVLAGLSVYSRRDLIGLSLAFAATVIAVRYAWFFAPRFLLRLRFRFTDDPAEEWKHRAIGAWAGFRGGVSLAAALAIPHVTASGADFPRRSLTIFTTFGVIFVTLVGQGLTLPLVIRRLKLKPEDAEGGALRSALCRLSQAALDRLEAMDAARDREAIELLRRRYRARLASYARGAPSGAAETVLSQDEQVTHDVLEAQRAELARLLRAESIDSTTFVRVEAMLDLEELHLCGLEAAGRTAIT
jgi:CPA1 family monovalent cation:H+ antiporter